MYCGLRFGGGLVRSARAMTTRANSLRWAARSGNLLRARTTGQRTITSAFQLGSGPAPPVKVKPYRWVYLLGGSLIVAYGSWKYYTRHNYPPEVAAKLRKALMAEINGAGYRKPDYKLALQYYLEALEEADNVGLHYLSDEYTGLQIKIAEVYEKLGMMEEARLLYREMGTSYIQALADGKTVAPALRPHIIQRDLRVALKTAMLESTINPAVAKMGLLVHFLMAQREVASRDPKIAEMINAEKTRSEINVSIDVDGATNKDQMEAWMPFREELFAARDMFVALCLATGDIGLALQTKLATTEWMTVAGCDIGDILMSCYNVASIFYLQGEEFELREMYGKQGSNKQQEDLARKMAEDSISNSSSCFNVILNVVEKLPSKARREPNVAEVHALSTYGLGVIALHKGHYDEASELLSESRLRAKGCEFDDLVTSAELELSNLEKIRNEKALGNDDNVEHGSPTIDVLLLKNKETAERSTTS